MINNDFQMIQMRVLDGVRIRLVPLCAADHADDLFDAVHVPEREDKFRYLVEAPPENRTTFRA